MSTVHITTDSHSCISQQKAKELGVRVLPMPFYIDGECYYEGVDLSRDLFFEKLEQGAQVSTSQPAVTEVTKMWDEELVSCDQILHVPISSGLSGSCETAQALANHKPYKGRVFVVDNGRIATPLYRSILDALELIKKGHDAPAIKRILEAARERMTIFLAMDTLEYLKRGGRISGATAVIGNVLNIKPVIQFDTGKLHVFKKCRGIKAAKKAALDAMHEALHTTFAKEFKEHKVHLVAATSADDESTKSWVETIKEAFPGMEVLCEPLSLGECCHIGPNALGIGCSCVPEPEC